MFYILYKITNTLNHKIYIGTHVTRDLNDGYMGSGSYLKNAIKKHGIEFFEKEIIDIFDSRELMYAAEKSIVNSEFLKRNDVYNLNEGGDGGWHFINQSGKNIYGKNGKNRFGGENLLRGNKLHDLLKSRGEYEGYINKLKTTLSDNHKSGKYEHSFTTENNPMNDEEIVRQIKIKYRLNGHQQKEKNSQYGTTWITNGEENKKIKSTENIPSGWTKGRKILSTKLNAK